jgi:hypothetical protein
MSEDIEDLIYEVRDICNEYEKIDSDFQDYMYIHSMSKRLNAKIVTLSTRYMEIDKMFTDKKTEHIKNVARERERLLDEGIFNAYNRAESKAEATHIELKAEAFEYERICSRLKMFINRASETLVDMRSYISSLKKEREYEQTGSHT